MVGGLLKRVFGGGGTFGAPEPEQPLFVIGDIHGRVDLLKRLLDKVPDGDWVICVGDYVDRGEHSADVLRLLVERPDITCLRGNHEDMLLRFLMNPEKHGSRWLRYGGLQTMMSFSVAGVTPTSNGDEMYGAQEALTEAMGPKMLEWMNDLETRVVSGNVAVVHAAADPALPIDAQPDEVLMWGHPAFLKSKRKDGIWVVHGHTIVDAASADQGRIAVDTGAYATGRLTAARIVPGQDVEFIAA